MFFIMGGGNKTEDLGTLDHSSCPACRNLTPLRVFKSYSYVSFFFIPIVKMNVTYMATCPICGHTMALNSKDGKEFEKTGSFVPSQESFTSMEQPISGGSPRFCGQCGRRLGPSDRFCPSCGVPIPQNQTDNH